MSAEYINTCLTDRPLGHYIANAYKVLAETEITPANIMAHVDQLTAAPVMTDNEDKKKKSVSATNLLNRQIEDIPCLVEPFLQEVGLACIAGSSDTGKSSLLRYLCMCIASGKNNFLGFNIKAKRRRAIYVSTEDDATAVAYLLRRQNRELNADPSRLKGLEFIFDTGNLLQDIDGILTDAPVDIGHVNKLKS